MSRSFHTLFLLATLLFACRASGDTIRVTTWNLEAATSTNSSLRDAAAVLAALDPDIILLQGVRDWAMCAQLAEELKPAEYGVAVCSAFPAVTGQRQVAILSRYKAYFSWSEALTSPPGGPPGGFAFAAIHVRKQRVGFFSVQWMAAAQPRDSVNQLLRQLETVRNWEQNKVQSIILAGAQDARAGTGREYLRSLEEAGFVDALNAPASAGIAAARPLRSNQPGPEFFLIEPNVFPNPIADSAAAAGPVPLTCELELDLAKATAAWTERAREAELRAQVEATRRLSVAAAENLTATNRFASARPPAVQPWQMAIIAALAFLAVVALWALVRKRGRAPSAPALLPEHAGAPATTVTSYTVVLGPAGTADSPGAPLPRQLVQGPEAGATQTHSTIWEQRAIEAEHKAERAQAIVRNGLMPHLRQWLKQKLVRKLASERAQLLEGQQAATRAALSVDQRLSRLETQLQQQNRGYERRIEELTCELVAAKEENRELIRARISQVRAEMEAARARVLAQAQENEG